MRPEQPCATRCLLSILTLLLMSAAAVPVFPQQETSVPDTVAITSSVPQSDISADRTPAPATNVTVVDAPDDAGNALLIRWEKSASDLDVGGQLKRYLVLRSRVVDGKPGDFEEVGEATNGMTQLRDGRVRDEYQYYYKVLAVNDSIENGTVIWRLTAESELGGPGQSSPQWFDMRRINVFVGILLVCGFIIYYIGQAKSGKELFIRKIAGLEAVDEAVGRATEMGKKIYYIPGSQDMDNVQTLAGIAILGRVAELSAQYETWLEVPVSRSLVMVTCREVVKEAYAKAGRPDAFQDDQVHYLTDDQFGYAAAIDGMVVRENPATIFLMGSFYAEALVLAETGNSVGAIQIAGTGQPSQLPFFVAACDYTLIGEELFAASAYLSREPNQLGSLKGQDLGKAVLLVAIVIGVILETAGIWQVSRLFTVIE